MHLSLLQPTPDYHPPRYFDPVYGVHQLVCHMLSDDAQKPPRYLFRLDASPKPTLYVLSQDEPVSTPREWRCRSTPYEPTFSEGGVFAFRVRVNATVFRDGHRHSIVADALHQATNGQTRKDITEEAYLTWFARQGEQHGFAVDSDRFQVTGHRRVKVRKARNGNLITFDAGDLAGRLTVTEPDAFAAASLGGIGRAKAFGCGLLQLQPAL